MHIICNFYYKIGILLYFLDKIDFSTEPNILEEDRSKGDNESEDESEFEGSVIERDDEVNNIDQLLIHSTPLLKKCEAFPLLETSSADTSLNDSWLERSEKRCARIDPDYHQEQDENYDDINIVLELTQLKTVHSQYTSHV